VNIALQCPCGKESDLWVWLELARRLLRWPTPPSFVWRHSSATPLVLSFGAPSPAILPFFASSSHPSQNIWPLTTRDELAVASASKALSATQVAGIDRRDATVDELITSLCRP
jgi:hypothetical protein